MALRRLLSLSAAALLAGTLAAPVAAQGPEKGDYSFGILLFTNETGSQVEFGRQWTDRLFGGIELDIREASVEDEVSAPQAGVDSKAATSDFQIGPVIRWYGRPVASVVPFVRIRAAIGWGEETFEQGGEVQFTDDAFTLAGSLAIGAEWFPMRQVSFSGYTGLAAGRTIRDRELANGSSAERTIFNSGTFRSALSVRFYFR